MNLEEVLAPWAPAMLGMRQRAQSRPSAVDGSLATLARRWPAATRAGAWPSWVP